jgi:threonyl-tRNA synthetase
LAKGLKKAGIRATVDDRNEKIGKKIRDAELTRVPYMFVVGEKEMDEQSVSVRRQGRGDLGIQTVSSITEQLRFEIAERKSD